jgi:lysophospholipase L1-like esterase
VHRSRDRSRFGAGGGGGAPSEDIAFGRDFFTDTAGTGLASHTATLGGGWTKHSSYATGDIVISNANRARQNAAALSVYYLTNATPSNDYRVVLDAVTLGSVTTIGIAARLSTSAATFYALSLSSSGTTLTLFRFIAGASTSLQSVTVVNKSGSRHRLELVCVGTLIKGYYNGAEVISVTDANIASGRAGIFMGDTASDTAGTHIDNLVVETIPAGAFGSDRAITLSDLWNNGYDNVAAPRQSTGSFVRFKTDARSVRVQATTTLNGDTPSAYDAVGVKVNGVRGPSLMCSSNAQQYLYLTGLPQGDNTIELEVGPTRIITGTVNGTWLDAVAVQGANLTTRFLSPSVTSRVLVYGDSISAGYEDQGFKGLAGYARLLRDTYNHEVMIEAWAGRTLNYDAVDASARTAFTARVTGYAPSTMLLLIGTNDYGLNVWTAANFGTAYAALLDALHTALPSMAIICVSPLARSTETANGLGSTLQNYRDQIQTICGARGWTTFVDGQPILSAGSMIGGIHPTTAQHATLAATLGAVLP